MTEPVDVSALVRDHAYAIEALATIRARAFEALPNTALIRAVHDPLLDIINTAGYGLRLNAEEASCTTRS